MINIEEIKKYYPDLPGFDRDILREYLQYKILDIIFKKEVSSKLVFIGGTAIKICYGSQRFSEDLDFDNFGISKAEFEGLSNEIKKELEFEGYEVEIRNVFKGAFRCYIKILKLLQENNMAVAKDEKILIQLDTASHGFSYQSANYLLQKFDVFRNIKLAPASMLLSMKAGAIFGRKRMKGRDFYDMVYLLSLADFDYGYLDLKLGIKTKKELKEKLLESAASVDLQAMAKDVLPFLFKPDDQERVLSFREYIEQKLG